AKTLLRGNTPLEIGQRVHGRSLISFVSRGHAYTGKQRTVGPEVSTPCPLSLAGVGEDHRTRHHVLNLEVETLGLTHLRTWAIEQVVSKYSLREGVYYRRGGTPWTTYAWKKRALWPKQEVLKWRRVLYHNSA
ncbi:unnamed protein product, partial [Ectocarpus sp. 4 AP-2014]